MTKIDKVQKMFELRGTTDYFRRQIQSLRRPVPKIEIEFLSITPNEEERVLLDMAAYEAMRWTDEELDISISFLESSAGKKLMDYRAGDECVKIFNEFMKKKITELPSPQRSRKVFIAPGSGSIN